MRRLIWKISVAVLLGVVGLGLMVYQKSFLKTRFEKNTTTSLVLQSIMTDIVAFKHAVLRANYFLYYNNDEIYRDLKRIDEKIARLLAEKDFREHHKKSYKGLVELKRHMAETEQMVTRFLTYNASLKNSSIYLPTLAKKAYELFDRKSDRGSRVILLLSQINASLFLAKNALDDTFVREIRKYRKALREEMTKVEDPKKKRLLRMSLRHMDLYIELFPAFSTMLQQILHSPLEREIRRVMASFTRESKEEMLQINRIAELFMVLYLLMIGAILYFIVYVEKESQVDMLTQLGNRKAYTLAKRRLGKPALVLVNIDQFKHINEYYGASVGDKLLIEVGRLLSRRLPDHESLKVFRMGGDDFGILLEHRDEASLIVLIERVLKLFETTRFEIDEIPPIEISVTVGASFAKERLFETADMALKEAKNSRRLRYRIYNPSIDKSETIARNIRASKQLKHAIAHDRIIPYFQPIREYASGRIVKYEALARIRLNEKEVLTPYHFLEAAKLTKLSGVITRAILRQTLEVARLTTVHFSVNISASDISSDEDNEAIFALLERYRDCADRITFEILESEELDDYDEVAVFINHVKRFGASVAIDDFGSGYSNFEKLLQLDLDILKIDGSLIKDLDHDEYARMVVELVVDFAKRAGLRTIAEFVHSKAVAEAAQSLGIHCAQGYYYGKPLPAEHYFEEVRGRENGASG
ncbi:MAG: EAL domain-containing protein [Epsilonproteobacteria bacterium]|nr:EAL domain-containing protein [Campylobacterota bacterium]